MRQTALSTDAQCEVYPPVPSPLSSRPWPVIFWHAGSLHVHESHYLPYVDVARRVRCGTDPPRITLRSAGTGRTHTTRGRVSGAPTMAPSLNSAATSAPFKPHWEPSVGWAPELRARRAQRRLVELRGRNPDLRRKDTSADPRGLTKRQRDVLELLAAGNSDAEIATAL